MSGPHPGDHYIDDDLEIEVYAVSDMHVVARPAMAPILSDVPLVYTRADFFNHCKEISDGHFQ